MRVKGEAMKENDRLFSIGKLSKLTGVHIQSLRYYEELGILKPAYTDPDTRYRYYTFSHMRIVEAFQYSAELDIPLKEFKNFLLEEDGQIDYAKLIDYGIQSTNEKMRRILKRLTFLENVQWEMEHARKCSTTPCIKSSFPEKLCWAVPYEGTQTGSGFHTAVYRLISDMEKNGLRAGYSNGQILFYTKERISSYLFIDIRETDRPLESFPMIMRIPAGEYLCSVSDKSDILSAPKMFPALFEQDYDKIVIEVELFSEKYNYTAPVFEIRCSLPQ